MSEDDEDEEEEEDDDDVDDDSDEELLELDTSLSWSSGSSPRCCLPSLFG